MNLKYKILAVLAAGIALTACGSSGAPASTPASSAVPASSHVAEEGDRAHQHADVDAG